MKMKLFCGIWHVCVKKFCGGWMNEIRSACNEWNLINVYSWELHAMVFNVILHWTAEKVVLGSSKKLLIRWDAHYRLLYPQLDSCFTLSAGDHCCTVALAIGLLLDIQYAKQLCNLLCRLLWVVVNFWVRGLSIPVFYWFFLGDSMTCMFCPSGSKQRLDPRALGWYNIRELSSLFLPCASSVC